VVEALTGEKNGEMIGQKLNIVPKGAKNYQNCENR